MSKSKPSKKRLIKLGAILIGLVLFWLALTPYRDARARSLVTQAEQIHATDPVRAIAMLREAIYIKSSAQRQSELERWQLVPQINAKPAGVNAVLLAKQLVGLRLYDSAEQVLTNGGELNSSGVALLAELRLDLNKDLTDSQVRLQKAVATDPSDIRLHQLLEKTDEKLGNKTAASDEAAKIDRLKAGKP